METIACELCGSDRSRILLRQKDLLHGVSNAEFTVVRCEVCGLLYLNPRPSPAEIGQYYPPQYFSPTLPKSRSGLEQSVKRFGKTVKRWIMEDYYGYPSATLLGPWRRIRKLLLWPEKARRVFRGRNFLPWIGQGRLLDVGCGPGVNLKTFQEQGWEVYGIEMSGTAVTQARERVGDRIHLGTFENAPFKDESFDVVLFSHTLEHLFRPADALARARRVLEPEGMVVIAVPNADSLEARLFGRWWVPWDPPRHLFHFEKATLIRLLERAGFRVVRFRTGVGSLFFMASLERAWTQRLGRPLPARWLMERAVARPFCLLAGHLGYGTEITVYAVKDAVQG